MTGGNILFSLLGTGSFFLLFLIGLSVAHSLGFPVLAILLMGFVTGAAGVVLVVQLERHHHEN